MESKITKEAIIAAKNFFDGNKLSKRVFATSDGHLFLPHFTDAVKNHAKKLENKEYWLMDRGIANKLFADGNTQNKNRNKNRNPIALCYQQ